jgi:glycosyltransferase involved in cell wall biosynthesis
MSVGRAPDISVILVTPDRYETIRTTVRKLQAQTVRDRVELVIVACSREALELDEEELAGLHGFRVVELARVKSVAAGNAAGVKAASAPVVVFAEDHSFPDPEWAAALIEAHRGPWAAVGPVVVNANPGSAVSWADFMLGYGPWLEPSPGGVVDYLPGHNSSYKRALLLELGSELEERLNAECVLHWDLRRMGHRLYLEPAARTFHVNFSRLPSWLRATFLQGRTFAAERARSEDWGLARRLAYAAAAPLIPPIRLRRSLRDLGRLDRRPQLARILPATVLGLLVSALGEALGYTAGPGGAPERISSFEFHRDRHVTGRDRALFTDAPTAHAVADAGP